MVEFICNVVWRLESSHSHSSVLGQISTLRPFLFASIAYKMIKESFVVPRKRSVFKTPRAFRLASRKVTRPPQELKSGTLELLTIHLIQSIFLRSLIYSLNDRLAQA
jgi:hypothetical protein